jgi:hypothetical protein
MYTNLLAINYQMRRITYKNDYLLLENEYLTKLFLDQELTTVKVSASKNCCTNFPEVIYNTNYPNTCIYEASYQNYQEQSICNPEASKQGEDCVAAPLSSYYSLISEIILFVDGKNTNIINRTYDITQQAEIDALQLTVDAFLASKGFSATFTITTSLDVNNFLGVFLSFAKLPPGVTFVNANLANSDTCYVNMVADCNTGINCVQQTFELNNPYNIIELNIDSFIYTPPVPIVSSNINTQIPLLNATLAAEGKDAVVSLNGVDLIIDYKESTPIYVKSLLGADQNVVFGECSLYEEPIIDCIYSVKIPLDKTKLSAILVLKDGLSYPTPLLTEGIDLSKDLVTINTTLNNAISTGNILVTKDDLYYTITFTDTDEIPSLVISEEENFLFLCSNLQNFTGDYDADTIEFSSEGIKLKEGYLGGLETGVYNIKLTTETEDEIILDQFCIFIDKDIKCAIAKIADLDDLIYASDLYNLLTLTQDCIDCQCEQSCIIYQELIRFLNSKGYGVRKCDC